MNNVTLNKAESSFFDFFYKIKSEKNNIYWSGHDSKPNYSNLKDWYLKQIESEARIIFSINTDQNVGYLYLDIDTENKKIELSYAISEGFSGCGLGTKAVSFATKYAIVNFPKYSITAFVTPTNIGSIRIMQKNNYLKTGLNYHHFLKMKNEKVEMQEYMFNKNKVFIIAEAGVNHNGDIGLAKKLIDVAVEAGVDAVKFQTWKTELLVTKDAKQAEYQTKNTMVEESQFDMLKKLELSYSNFEELKTYCDKKDILFLSTPDETSSADFLSTLQETFKIGSGELTNLPFLRHIGSFNKNVILSTGMSNLKEIEDALEVLTKAGTPLENISVLHANTQYPTPIEDVNLNAMITIRDKFNVKIGYSDHTLGIEVPIAAVAMGAKIIEKHFTIDTSMSGPDHKASLNPEELKLMVQAIRNIEQAMGSTVKQASKSEIPNIEIVRKSIVANCNIKKGDIFSNKNIAAKRPGTGISPMKWDKIIGTKSLKNYSEGELL